MKRAPLVNAIKDWKDIFRIHGNKDFGSNWSGKFDEYVTVIHIPTKDLVDACGKKNIFVVVQNGISRRYPDYRKGGFKYRHKVMYSRLMTYIEAEAEYGLLKANSFPMPVVTPPIFNNTDTHTEESAK